jgi:putative transposase
VKRGKRVHRLYRLEGLQMRHKPPRRRVTARIRDDRSNAIGPNQVWAMENLGATSQGPFQG